MIAKQGYYCFIQFCPDLGREEAANIGVLVLSPEHSFVGAMTAKSNIHVRRAFPDHSVDMAFLTSLKSNIVGRVENERSNLRTLDDLQRFIDTRANNIRFTKPRVMSVWDPEVDLRRLFTRLIVDPPQPQRKKRQKVQEIHSVLVKLHEQGVADLTTKVRVPFLQTELTVDYSYRNGSRNLLKAWRPANSDHARRLTLDLATKGKLIHEFPSLDAPRTVLQVFSACDPDGSGRDLEDLAQPVFDRFCVRFVRRQDALKFAEQVSKEAHK